MPVDDKVKQNEFTLVTRLDADAVRTAAHVAAERSTQFLGPTVSEHRRTESAISYSVKGLAKVMTLMAFSVDWEPLEDGRLRVRLRVGEYLTTRSTYLFIPISPKRAPALGALSSFSDGLRRALEA